MALPPALYLHFIIFHIGNPLYFLLRFIIILFLKKYNFLGKFLHTKAGNNCIFGQNAL